MAFGTLRADTLTHSTAGSLDTNYVVGGSAKVWCSHESDSTVNGSLNVSSTTDNPSTTGQTQVSFTSSMADANFVVTACHRHTSGGSFTQASDLTTGSFRDYSFLSSDQSRPEKNVMAVAHGDLA